LTEEDSFAIAHASKRKGNILKTKLAGSLHCCLRKICLYVKVTFNAIEIGIWSIAVVNGHTNHYTENYRQKPTTTDKYYLQTSDKKF